MSTVTIPDEHNNARLDRALAALLPDVSRSRLKALIEAGDVTLDKKITTDASLKVKSGQTATLIIPPPAAAEPEAQDIPLDIVYEDDDLLVLNKPAGLVVHPAAGHHDGTLVNALLHHCADSLSGIGGVKRPGIVHRLDKDTSGLMLVAKNDAAHASLSSQLSDRTMSRTYHAIVWGVPQPPKGRVAAPINRNPHDRLRQAVRPDGRFAATNYKTLETFGNTATLMECKLETGRTHQIRVHMAHIKHNVVGDPLYGIQKTAIAAHLKRANITGKKADTIVGFPRQALHAFELTFKHPVTGKAMTFNAPAPDDMKALIKALASA